MGTHMPYGITQCYLPPGRGDIPDFTPANKASAWCIDPGWMQGWVDLVGWEGFSVMTYFVLSGTLNLNPVNLAVIWQALCVGQCVVGGEKFRQWSRCDVFAAVAWGRRSTRTCRQCQTTKGLLSNLSYTSLGMQSPRLSISPTSIIGMQHFEAVRITTAVEKCRRWKGSTSQSIPAVKSSDTGPFTCDDCGRKFSARIDLIGYMKIHRK